MYNQYSKTCCNKLCLEPLAKPVLEGTHSLNRSSDKPNFGTNHMLYNDMLGDARSDQKTMSRKYSQKNRLTIVRLIFLKLIALNSLCICLKY
jgi:hypothetical protein